MAAAPVEPAAALAEAIAGVATDSLKDLSSRLVELQESQATLCTTIGAKSTELTSSSPEWAAAKAILDKLPEYKAKVERIRRTMGATLVRLERVDKAAAGLRAKVDERDKERAARKSADSAGYASVAAR